METLPIELFEMVVNSTTNSGHPYLNAPDICNLRLVNHQLQAATFEIFAKRFFTTRKHFIDRRSLDALLQIANHSNFSDYVRVVAIGPERINNMFVANPCLKHGKISGTWDADFLGDCCPVEVLQFANCVREHVNYEKSGEPTKTLENALQKFKNLEVVRLDSYVDIENEDGQPQAWGAQRYYHMAADIERAGLKKVDPIVNDCFSEVDYSLPWHILIHRGLRNEGLLREYSHVTDALYRIRGRKDWILESRCD
jgi:hypothetical protein